ncbi:restriction endonuclease subunit S [Vibrio alginolyticus]|uniref:restriction endonuclease subunit S n=1 Tax=Vibrio TaxID=662 RepID=UPI001F02377B|nr:restriction endonuclease subunit S [Vibrio sp. D54]MCF7510862.1 restriction endonuclease subunit S [Vibrio sp. D54]
MQSNWEIKRISDICEYHNNKRVPLKSIDRAKRQGSYPYYGASGIVDSIDDYIFDGTYLLISEDGENLRSRKTPIAFKATGQFWVNNHAHILAEKEEGILDYLEYYFSYLSLTPYLTGAVQPKLSKQSLEAIEIPVPPLEDRLKINEILNSFTHKIANNKAMNQTLEKLAQRIFKSWFIDFDPVKANKEGLPFDGLSPEIQALFPSEFEDSELGMIPKGWEVSTIKQLQEKLSKGTTPRKKDVESAQDAPSIPFIKVRNISDTGSIESELETVASSIHEGALKRSILQSEDLLFTIAGTIGRVAIVPDRLNNSNCNQAVCFIRLKDKPTYNNYLYLHLKSKRIQEQISSKVVQAVQANASLQNINDINFPLPTNKLMESWNKVTLPLFDRIKEIEKQNITLTGLRDRLLPKLVSGQISVGEATQELAEAI